MSNLDKEILSSFIEESNALVQSSAQILEAVESDLDLAFKLKDYGNFVDRIMGGAQSISIQLVNCKPLIFIGDVAALCKSVSYKASAMTGNPALVEICVALLLDATEILQEVLNDLSQDDVAVNQSDVDVKSRFSKHFIERLRWAATQFPADVRGTVSSSSSQNSQNEIDFWLKKLGLN